MERALKSSFSSPQAQVEAFSDDLWTVGTTADDFFVDNLLDFSEAPLEEEAELAEDKTIVLPNKENVLSPEPEPEPEEKLKDCCVTVESDICFPADDVADLEWLSHFVDDSSSGYSLTLPPGKLSFKHQAKQIPAPNRPIFTSHVQTKARSKRTRTGLRVWSLGSHSLTDSSTSSSSSSSNTSLSSPTILCPMSAESLGKRKQGAEISGSQPRRCSHCLVQKTPQWRTGPLGAKTLCNACGVRYKSGRLLPEYRPACSPTFSRQIHSNNHRKVLEMRRKKEGEDGLVN